MYVQTSLLDKDSIRNTISLWGFSYHSVGQCNSQADPLQPPQEQLSHYEN